MAKRKQDTEADERIKAAKKAKAAKAKARKQDAVAEKHANKMEVAIEACFARTATYASCVTPAQVTEAAGLPLIEGAPVKGSGKLGVLAVTASSYVIVSSSRSGEIFSVGRSTGTANLTRTCTAAYVGLCPSTGAWGPNSAPGKFAK